MIYLYNPDTLRYTGTADSLAYSGTSFTTAAPTVSESVYNQSTDSWVSVDDLPVVAASAIDNVIIGLPEDAIIHAPIGINFSVTQQGHEFDIDVDLSIAVSSPTRVIQPSVFELSPSIQKTKSKAITILESVVKSSRERYITITPGQEITYQNKLSDATNYNANGVIGPWLQAEMNATGMTAADASQFILVTAAAWAPIGALIEETRRLCKIQITASNNKLAVESALSTAMQALSQI